MTKNQIVTDVTMYVILTNGVKNIVEEHIARMDIHELSLLKMENKSDEIN